MDDSLLANSEINILERMFDEVNKQTNQKTLPCCGLQIDPEKIQRGDSLNYLGYRRSLQNVSPQKVQNRRKQLRTLNDYQMY